MARQEDDCWRCGASWVVAEDTGAMTEAQLAADRWADEGGSFDPNGTGLSPAPPGRRSAAVSPQR